MTAFQHRQSAHCESGVMASLLTHAGLPMSEPMAFGLASGLAFAYLPIVKLGGMPLIAYRMPPRHLIKTLSKRLGVRLTSRTFSNPEQGRVALDAALDSGRLAGLQSSVFWLPYFPPEMRFHFNAHNLYGEIGREQINMIPAFSQASGPSGHHCRVHHGNADGTSDGRNQIFPFKTEITAGQVQPPAARLHDGQLVIKIIRA